MRKILTTENGSCQPFNIQIRIRTTT